MSSGLPEGAVRACGDGCTIALWIVPRASRTRIVGCMDDRLKVQVAAPPVDGAANAELVDFLAKLLHVKRGAVCVASGQSSKQKLVEVKGLGAAAAREQLAAAIPATT